MVLQKPGNSPGPGPEVAERQKFSKSERRKETGITKEMERIN